MTESIIVAVITGGLSLVGVIIASLAAHGKTMAAVEKVQALTDQRLDQLTRSREKEAERMKGTILGKRLLCL